jgi:5-methylcytosine-specific restriction protein A
VAWKHPKTSSSARGYGSAWQRLRAQVLGDEPLCRMCNKAGRLRLARELDHIKPKSHGGTDERANLQPLCVECHTLKTARDKGHTLRARTGADGWPVG